MTETENFLIEIELLCDVWYVDEARAALVTGADFEYELRFDGIWKRSNLCQVIAGDEFTESREECRPPHVFIDWAISKNLAPVWLDWAIEKGLYIPQDRRLQIAQEPALTAGALFDKSNEHYPPELVIALEAWRAVDKSDSRNTPKTRIENWLKVHHPHLSNEAIKRICIVANWDKTGGAPTTP